MPGSGAWGLSPCRAGSLRAVSNPEDPTPQQVAEMLDREAIRLLQARYADLVARRAWSELVDLYLPDLPFELDLGDRGVRHMSGPVEVGAFLDAAVARFDFFVFVPVNSVIDLHPGGDRDAATARFWMREDRHVGDASGGATEHETGWTSAHGLYRDTYRRVAGRWWFAQRRYTSLARSGVEPAVTRSPEGLA